MSNKKSSKVGGLNWAKLGTVAAEPATRACYDPTGVAITLEAKDEKASGGEGIVYTVPGKPGFLVKVYKRETLENPSKANAIRERIEAMCENRACQAMKGLAWPLMPVYGDASRKNLIGFAMRACKGMPFSSLFNGPASVKEKFPAWNRRQLAQTAVNFVKRVRLLAESNVLVNDFNPANFWVDEQCNVSFIDVDSFQIADRRGRPLVTHTYFASHTAPELLASPSALNRPRTVEHVAFSAALVAFQLLMCGYHPYSYQGVPDGGGCGSPDENLRAGRCPLGIGADCRLPDCWYKLWSQLTGKLKNAFITTFRNGHSAPAMRTPLGDLEFALNGLLITMAKDADPDRVSLNPCKVKSHEWIQTPAAPRSFMPRPAYPSRGFMRTPGFARPPYVPQQQYNPQGYGRFPTPRMGGTTSNFNPNLY